MIKIKNLLTLVSFSVFFLSTKCILSQNSKPNIVHILTDDFGWQDPVCFDVDGKTPFETPNLDKLAKRGRMFKQAYAPSPTCAPSRAAYVSGQYPAHTGVYHVFGGKLPRAYYEGRKELTSHINPFYRYRLPLSETTIPKELKKAGYITAHVGKWHLGGRSNGYPFPGDYGFDISYIEDTKKGGRGLYYPDSDIWVGKNKKHHNGLASSMIPDRLSDFATNNSDDSFQLDKDGRPFDQTLDVALRWLKKNHEQPFFLNYATYFVHAPFQTRNKERFAYYCKKMGYEFPKDPGAINVEIKGKSNPYYATMVDTLDWMIGKVITYLEETDDPRNPGHKLIDNTYIVISSDNGGLVNHKRVSITDNAPLRDGKHFLHEGGVRVPFIVSGPSIPENTSCETPISLIDLYPTFMSMAGLPKSTNTKIDGCNILPIMEGKESNAYFYNGKKREAIYFYFPVENSSGSAMRKGPWKIYRNLAPGINRNPIVELYKLYHEDGSFADIGEKNNLANEMPELREALLTEIDEFHKKANVRLPYKNVNSVTPLKGQANVPKVLERGTDKNKVWATVETGKEKSKIVDATLLYTVNGGEFDYSSNGRREMWFELPAIIKKTRVEGIVPPGASHAVLCMVDEEGFLITSEPLPSNKKKPFKISDSSLLQDGYKFRPGLYSLIELGECALKELPKENISKKTLAQSIKNAKSIYNNTGNVSDNDYYKVVRELRKTIRDLKGIVSQANDEYLNLFRQSQAF